MAEEAILGYLENHEEIADSGEFAATRGIDHNDVVNVIKSLHGFRYIEAQVTPFGRQPQNYLNYICKYPLYKNMCIM